MAQVNVYNLQEKTAVFGESIIEFAKTIEKNDITRPLIRQIVRSATSVGANYMEADGAESRKDFRHKIALCKKETMETKHWIRMIAKASPKTSSAGRILWKEAQELTSSSHR